MKYNVYLAEDEYMLREYVKSNRMWEDGPYVLCGDASNGEDAWEDIQAAPVDILITDIKMPFMDGLELSRLVCANRPEIKVIILSGYDDFAYAKQALTLGVTDYLLKPLKPEDLLNTLARAAELIDKERRQRQSVSRLEQLASESLETNRHKFLSQLCSGLLPRDVIRKKAQALQLELSARWYVCCLLTVCELRRAEADGEAYLTFVDCSQAMRLFESEHPDCVWYSNDISQFHFIVLGDSESQVLEKARAYLTELQETLKLRLKLTQLSAVIGTPCGDLCDLSGSMLSAQIAAGLLPQPRCGGVSLVSDCKSLLQNDHYTAVEKDLFRSLLATGSRKDVSEFIGAMVGRLEGTQMSRLYLTYVCLDILTAVSDFIRSLDGGKSVQLSMPDLNQLFNCGHDLSGFRTALESVAAQAIRLRDQSRGGKNDDIIQNARSFILEHYTEPTLDLSAVAGHVSINSAYFSKLFKQETGQCFIEYLTSLRINKAKELLRATHLRTSDIAYSVGYTDQNYFSKLFKKCVGMSAREFRQS